MTDLFRRCCALLLCLLAVGWPAIALSAPTAADAATQLARVKSRIREVTDTVQGEVARRDGVAAALHAADTELAAARKRLEEARLKHAASDARRAELKAQQVQTAEALARERAQLAAQLRAAYVGGRDEQLKVLLNAEDPVRLGRMLAYYGYLGRARTERLQAIDADSVRLEALDEELAAESVRFAALEADRRREAESFEAARVARARALGVLNARIADRSAQLKDLKANASSLEDLMTRLRAALENLDDGEVLGPGAARRPFVEVRGRLSWPARGRLAARFGDARAGGLRWNGVLLETRPRAEVHAAYFGRVVYADWLPGLGLLLILDHGGGYLSLYGYNETLYKSAGDRVRPGELIAGAFGEGGRPELYFEIRQGARPLDPKAWLKGAPHP